MGDLIRDELGADLDPAEARRRRVEEIERRYAETAEHGVEIRLAIGVCNGGAYSIAVMERPGLPDGLFASGCGIPIDRDDDPSLVNVWFTHMGRGLLHLIEDAADFEVLPVPLRAALYPRGRKR